MQASYTVDLYDSAGRPLRVPLDGFTRLEYINRINGLGRGAVTFKQSMLPPGTDVEKLAADARLVVWRNPEALGKYIDFSGLMRKPRIFLLGQSFGVELEGYGQNELLKRRIVAFAAGSDEAKKSGAADTVIGELWDENMGASADTDRQMTGEGFDVGPIAGTGTSVNISFSRSFVYDAMVKTAKQSLATPATAVYFGFVPLGDGLEGRLDVRVGRWGQDRRGQVEFSINAGNMTRPVYEVDRRDELTVVYSAGTGRKDQRIEGTPQIDATRLVASPLNRREGFFDGRNYGTAATLEDAARELLEASGIVRSLEFEVMETPACRYGYHWHLGDLVDGTWAGVTRDYMITGVRVVVSRGEDLATAILEEYHG